MAFASLTFALTAFSVVFAGAHAWLFIKANGALNDSFWTDEAPAAPLPCLYWSELDASVTAKMEG